MPATESLPESDREGDLAHPRETARLAGHDEAERLLADTLRLKRMPHAWLIGGPKSVGKATLAYRCARAVLAGAAFSPIGAPLGMAMDAAVFHRVATGTHPGLMVLRRPWDEKAKRFKTQLPVEEIRRLYPFLGGKSEGPRVCIVDTADDMNANTANAFLKILEEPPQGVLFLLLAEAPGRLLPTIRSRCRRLTLAPVNETTMREFFALAAPQLADGDRPQLTRLAQGCPGRALVLVEAGGLALYREMVGVLSALPRIDATRLNALSDRLSRVAEEQAYRQAMDMLLAWLHRITHDALLGAGLEIVEGEGRALQRLAGMASLESWAALWDKARELAGRSQALALDKKTTLTAIVHAMARNAEGARVNL